MDRVQGGDPMAAALDRLESTQADGDWFDHAVVCHERPPGEDGPDRGFCSRIAHGVDDFLAVDERSDDDSAGGRRAGAAVRGAGAGGCAEEPADSGRPGLMALQRHVGSVVALGVYERHSAAVGLGRDEGREPADVVPPRGGGGTRAAVATAVDRDDGSDDHGTHAWRQQSTRSCQYQPLGSNSAAGIPNLSVGQIDGGASVVDLMGRPDIPNSAQTPDSDHYAQTGLLTPPATLSGANAITYVPTCNQIEPVPDSGDLIVVPGWKKRNVGVDGPDTRSPPSIKTAIERRLLDMKDRNGAEIFEPVVGTDFDSCQEAYDFYNLYSWEHGFGIRRGRSRVNTNKYRSMHDLVCQCAGKNDREFIIMQD